MDKDTVWLIFWALGAAYGLFALRKSGRRIAAVCAGAFAFLLLLSFVGYEAKRIVTWAIVLSPAVFEAFRRGYLHLVLSPVAAAKKFTAALGPPEPKKWHRTAVAAVTVVFLWLASLAVLDDGTRRLVRLKMEAPEAYQAELDRRAGDIEEARARGEFCADKAGARAAAQTFFEREHEDEIDKLLHSPLKPGTHEITGMEIDALGCGEYIVYYRMNAETEAGGRTAFIYVQIAEIRDKNENPYSSFRDRIGLFPDRDPGAAGRRQDREKWNKEWRALLLPIPGRENERWNLAETRLIRDR